MLQTTLKYSLIAAMALQGLSAQTLFFDDFDGTGDLNGTTPNWYGCL